MFLIVGLGNPGLNYACTRHNLGFMLADYLAYELGFPDFREKFDSVYTEKSFDGNAKVFIQKPQTYMNNSGRAVSRLVAYYKIEPQNVFVIQDDLDLKPLQVRIRFGGSNGGHNGLRDIETVTGRNYWHIKIGIGRPLEKSQVADYVLSPFYKDELTAMQSRIFPGIGNNIIELVFSSDKSAVIKKIMQEVSCL
ncbi:MAG: aminoacyl-tRNA hydrolase [Alphaproteobacteria bacterium]|nr:aminoacyl-tRNA hydrolase [Alphaproteobacteria bacterium]